jgi:Fe-S cluster assembly scaffold protein SufB
MAGCLSRRTQSDLASQGVIFTDLHSALNEHPELVSKTFMTTGGEARL